jgi:FAD:protein FMN transferase
MRPENQHPSGAPLPVEPAAGLALGGEHPPSVHRFSHEAMATTFEVHADHPDGRYAAQAAHAAFDLLDRLEGDLSRFRPNSDISRINQLGAGETIRVSAATLECLAIARHLHDLTGGAFDVAIGSGLTSLVLDAGAMTVGTTHAGVRLDLGGIGKGYAVDCMADLLEEWGLERTLVHGGFSSMRALQPPAGRDGWLLTLSDPSDPSRILATVPAARSALAASGQRRGGHIIDPRTGQPSAGRPGAWVALPQPERAAASPGDAGTPRAAPAAVADALTTAFMLLAMEEIESLCRAPPGLEAWILTSPDGPGTGEPRLHHLGGASPNPPVASSGL